MFIGRFGAEEENQRFLKLIAKRGQTSAALFPIPVRGRVVNLLYGDGGPAAGVKNNLGELILLLQKVPKAYLRIIRKRLAEARESAVGVAKRPVPTRKE
jgi:hypothetical protein